MASSPKERFDAAVKVIHGLPKNGPFQPSYDMMLNFYGYFKQATEGQCTKAKPWAWDLIAKKKWDAWSKLGDMDKEEAMISYVEELKKSIKICTEKLREMNQNGDAGIVEAMPQDQVVREFMSKLGDFYEIVEEKMPVADEMERNHIMEVTGGDLDLDHSMRVDIARQLEEEEREDDRLDEIGRGEMEDLELAVAEDITPDQFTIGPVNSDSEEEFCDTSDHQSQDSESPPLEVDEVIASQTVTQVSTPVKPVTGKAASRVHFNTSMTVVAGNEIRQEVMSPISKTGLNSNIPFRAMNGNPRQLSDSLLTHAPSPDYQNVSLESVPDVHNSSSSSVEDSISGQIREQTPLTLGARGGGDFSSGSQQQQKARTARGGATGTSPPRSHSGGRGQDQALLSASGTSSDQMAVTLMRLQQDMNRVLARLDSMESTVLQRGSQPEKKGGKSKSVWNSAWWPFPTLTGRTFFFVFVWPFIVHWLLIRIFRRRRQNR